MKDCDATLTATSGWCSTTASGNTTSRSRAARSAAARKAGAWLTPKGTIAVYDHREQELYTYDEYDAFADDEGVDERLRADVADALGEKYVEELDI